MSTPGQVYDEIKRRLAGDSPTVDLIDGDGGSTYKIRSNRVSVYHFVSVEVLSSMSAEGAAEAVASKWYRKTMRQGG